ncbi:hypothetical protein BpHYR1_051535 [Brachionus plicatilis]|uniref:Uncharacterized protein n=1 Tax=Brachionus plicatilis TaxID=10195 RepID=A0A3M7SFJ4_BRAPC|nr:hypothetical protein BpHYR1_051535 [Brachionus plicatilis]
MIYLDVILHLKVVETAEFERPNSCAIDDLYTSIRNLDVSLFCKFNKIREIFFFNIKFERFCEVQAKRIEQSFKINSYYYYYKCNLQRAELAELGLYFAQIIILSQ